MKTGLALLATLLVQVPIMAQSWPAFRHDQSRSGIADHAVQPERLELAWKWKSELPPDPAWDGPARWDAYAKIRDLPAMRQYDACFHPVSDGEVVYFGSSSQDCLTALRLVDGKIVWRYVAGGPIRLAPTIHDNLVLFGCDDGHAYCLNKVSGQLIWKFNPSVHQVAEQRRLINNDRLISYYPVRTGVTVRDGLAYFGASFLPWRESFICSVNVETGTLDSENTFVKKHENATLEGSLLIAEDRLIVPQGRVAPLLFNRSNGESLGSLPGGGGVTIVLTESGDMVRTEGGRAARKGQIGVFKGKERIASFPRGRSLVVTQDRFFVIDGRKLFAADRLNNELKWSLELVEPLEIIKSGETIFVGGRDHITAVSATDGRIVWTTETKGRIFGLAVAGERLIAAADTGSIQVFAPSGKTDWKAPVSFAKKDWVSPEVSPVTEKGLLHRWVFHRSAMHSATGQGVEGRLLSNITVQDQAGETELRLSGTAEATQIGDSRSVEAIKLESGFFPIDPQLATDMPDAISLEAWVRIDQTSTWGGVVGFIQDDGAVEHGWLLGYRDDKFCLAIAGGGNGLTYLTAKDSFPLLQWHHVVGTYNGKEMRLYVNGSLAAESTAESGPISRSEHQHFTVGAYKDANESYPLNGALHEVRIYSGALDADKVKQLHAELASQFDVPIDTDSKTESFLTWGPVAKFVAPGQVAISYGTQSATQSIVDMIIGDSVKQTKALTPTKNHRVVINDLPWRRELQFRIRDSEADDARVSESYALDTHFDWTTLRESSQSEWIQSVIEKSPNPRGLAVLVGTDQAQKAVQLAAESKFNVVLVVPSGEVASEIRQKWMADPLIRYGKDLCVTSTPLSFLPGASASVVISKNPNPSIKRLVRPQGGLLLGDQIQDLREPIKGSGEWSHMYGLADNSAFGGENLSEVTNREDLVTQWIGRPGPRYKTDRQNRKPSPLAAGGRLFLQGHQRMIALDSYSGVVLWSVESPTVMRWNVPHDCSNWCADSEGVFVAAENRAWFMSGRTGEIERHFELPIDETTAKEKSWGFIGRHKDQLLGTAVTTSAIYTKWWGSSQWFDSTGGADTHIVAGDMLFSMDHKTGNLQWRYNGLILHPTITVMDGDVYFVEDKTLSHIQSPTRRINVGAEQSFELVCLDVSTGQKKWRRPIAAFSGHLASLYLAGGGDKKHRKLVLAASESTLKEFTVQAFDPKSGEPAWKRKIAWESNHHGKHISRPAIQGDLLYLRPEVLQLADGETVHRGFPSGHGCSSYTLSTNGLFSRLGDTTWWDVRNDKVNRFDRIRTDCWISIVPAQGMLLSAEGGGGCSCGSWLETSLGFLPRSVDQSFPEK